MRVNGQNWFPYLPLAWLQRLVDLIARSTPSRIDADWCLEGNRFSFTRSNASQFISQLRTLGWIDDEGVLSATGRNLRLQGEQYRQFMLDEIGRVYDELAGQFDDPGFDRQALETYFTSASSLGLSGRRQVVSTFRWFLTQAGLTELAERLGAPGVPAASGNRRPARQAARARSSRPSAPRGEQRDTGLPVLSGITLSISLQLPAVDDERVYQAIFRAMREHLLGGQASTE
jgi:hypothetical protein